MNRLLTLSIALVAGAGVASAQTRPPSELPSLRARLEANANKISHLKAELAAEKALDDQLLANTAKLVTESYKRWSDIDKIRLGLPALEDKTQFLWVYDNEAYIIGANLQIRNGSALANNSLGNLIIGHNELRPSGNIRSGSHNLVIGNRANYSREYGIIGGYENNLYAPYSAILSGQGNEVSGSNLYQVILSGQGNRTTANASVIMTGEGNLNSSTRSVIATGKFNTILFGYENAILTGESGMIQDSIRSLVMTGLRSKITGSQYSGIGTGIDNVISNSTYTFRATK